MAKLAFFLFFPAFFSPTTQILGSVQSFSIDSEPVSSELLSALADIGMSIVFELN